MGQDELILFSVLVDDCCGLYDENECLMIQVEMVTIWAELDVNAILMQSIVIMKMKLLTCRLLV